MADPVARLNEALDSRYLVEHEIGAGGMAMVYLATDLRHERHVALKVLRPELSAALGAERFLAEIRTTANLQHPHILPLFDSGEADGMLFYVMPYVKGESLRERLDREHELPVDEAVRIVSMIGSALQHAHEHGVLHRDVKPANVMLSDGLPVLGDFGIALAVENADEGRLTRSGMSLGTPKYSSPEQVTGDGPVDARSDVYSLACVLYELIAGAPPHAARSTQALVAKRLTVEPRPVRELCVGVPAHVDAALRRALHIAPSARHESIDEFTRELAEGVPVTTASPPSVTLTGPVAPAPTAFVGRARERVELLERLDAVGEGRGSLVLLGGEPGVGKTRLSEFVLEQARARQYLAVVGHAYELEGMPPFTPFIEQIEYTARVVPPDAFRAALGDAAPEIARMIPALRRQFSDIGPGIELPADQFRHYLFHRYGEFIERSAQVSPMVVLFDDLHWADEGSLLLLEHLVQELHRMPILVVGTYRDAELEVGRPFAASLERLLRQHSVHRVTLKPLAKQEVEELLQALGGSPPPEPLVEMIYHDTEGNPFFVQEVFRHLDEEGRLLDEDGVWRRELKAQELDVPESVRLVVGRRLERVSADCRGVLTTASVIGPRFALAVLEALGELEEDALFDALEEAEASQLIRSIGGQRDPEYGFTHELIRQTLVDTISIPRRQRRHVRIAAALKAAYGERIDDRASDMAHHLYQAGAAADPDETIGFLRLAADQALSRSGYEEALAQYERALSLEEDVPEPLLPVLLEGKVNALDGMGRWVEVGDVGKRALELYEACGETAGLARLAQLVCNRLEWGARYHEAATVGRRALEVLSDAPGPYRARLKCEVGVALDLVDEPGSRELIEEGLAEAEALGDQGAVLKAKLSLTIWHYHEARFEEAARVGEEVWQDLREASDQTTRADFLWIRSLILPFLGRLDEALVSVQEAREVGHERSEVGAEVNAALGELVVTGMRTGDGRAIESLGRALAKEFRSRTVWSRAGLFYAGLGLLWRGDTAGAADLMDVDTGGVREPRLWNALSAGWRFRTAAYAGMPEAEMLSDAAAPLIFRADRRAFPGDGFGLHATIEGLVVLDRIREAADLYQDAVASLSLGPLGHMDGLWACTTGLSAACGEEWDAAEDHFTTALEQAETVPHVMAQYETRRWWAWTLLRRGAPGDRETASELLSAARDGYRRLEAYFLEELATVMLAEADSP